MRHQFQSLRKRIQIRFTHCVKSVQMRSFFWSVFSRIRTEYRDLLCKSPYSVRMRENKNQEKLQRQTLKVILSEQFNMAIITVRENESLSRYIKGWVKGQIAVEGQMLVQSRNYTNN